MISKKAFVLAAGFGKRLRPYTDHTPKPLVKLGGETLLDRTLDQLADAGITDAVINTHYLAGKIESHVQGRKKPAVKISHEKTLLDLGGGVKQALPFFMDEPFFVLAGDGWYEDAPAESVLERMKHLWNAEIMDILLLLYPVSVMILTKGVGDYDLGDDNRAARSKNRTGKYMFASIRINHPRIFENTPEGGFSYLDLMDRAEKEGRLFGIVHTGTWHHISAPADLENAERSLKKS
ncbi:MAG: nucleotidyltransferase family protein [Alphaproteobacteria bacterium]